MVQTGFLFGFMPWLPLITYKELIKYFKIDNQYSFKKNIVLHIIIFSN